ncbi:hypothetical protein B0T25DRAFT_455283 [Lasiosphaeria hispida]|uniref:Extracellular membrane protein CFEM domain-containing protein n=1 Tax=Lasiosphaeria hispida TaxID=260671 RepID=A0AAJ0MF02_9PEZI|nr:hypothetical protein B0T25DRAFT_455283 [Lasiosphaeria hispida]
MAVIFALFFLWTGARPTAAMDSSKKWSLYYETPDWNALSACAQPCVADVDDSLRCWSYGCVCSECTPGSNFLNFLNGSKHIQKCVRDSCPQFDELAVNDALDAFQSICSVSYFTAAGTAPVTITATVPAVVATPTFDGANPVLIDHPDSPYNELTPCRWVLNNCESPKDNDQNCKPSKPGDHSKIWTGLGRYLQCSTAECICSDSKFFYSTQKLYERADLFCSIGFPYEGDENSPEFKRTIKMLADYCSAEGYILAEWIVTVVGFAEEAGMSTDTIVATVIGVISIVLAIESCYLSPGETSAWQKKSAFFDLCFREPYIAVNHPFLRPISPVIIPCPTSQCNDIASNRQIPM